MTSSTHARPPFRHRTLRHDDGSTLVMRTDGTITTQTAEGKADQVWAEDEPGWAAQAIRFGIRPRTATAKPGRPDPVARPADR